MKTNKTGAFGRRKKLKPETLEKKIARHVKKARSMAARGIPEDTVNGFIHEKVQETLREGGAV